VNTTGPEIIALCNVLERPIHVYELVVLEEVDSKKFGIRRMAPFGSPKFDRERTLDILSVDGRFPNIRPGQQRASGDHFLALFPDRRPPPVTQQELESLEAALAIEASEASIAASKNRTSILSRIKKWFQKLKRRGEEKNVTASS
jgi:hypothetical protein